MVEAYNVASPQAKAALAEFRAVEEQKKARPEQLVQDAKSEAGTVHATERTQQGCTDPKPGDPGHKSDQGKESAELAAVYAALAVPRNAAEHTGQIQCASPEAIDSMRAALAAHFGPQHERTGPEEGGQQASLRPAPRENGGVADAAFVESKK